jgi:hypothetical protein
MFSIYKTSAKPEQSKKPALQLVTSSEPQKPAKPGKFVSNETVQNDVLERIQSALDAIKPTGYDVALRVTWSCMALGLPQGYLIAWCANKPEWVKKAWISNKPESVPAGKKPIGGETLFSMARERGWKDPNPGLGLTTLPGALAAPTLKEIAEVNKKLEAETKKRKSKFDGYPPAPKDHYYLTKKGGEYYAETFRLVPADDTETVGKEKHPLAGYLAVPVLTLESEFCTVAYFPPDESKPKLNAPGCKFEGKTGKAMLFSAYNLDNKPFQHIYVVEGIGHYFSIRRADPHAGVACAFSAGNLESVARALRVRYKAAHITIISDKGSEKEAEQAARAVKGDWIELMGPWSRGADINDIEQGFIGATDLFGGSDNIPVQSKAVTKALQIGRHPYQNASPANPLVSVQTPNGEPIEYPHKTKSGRVEAKPENIAIALTHRIHGIPALGYDTMLGAVVVGEGETSRALSDNDYTTWIIACQRDNFLDIQPKKMAAAVEFVARQNTFDSMMIWTDALVWDGIPRVATFLERYLHVPASDYHRALSEYIWTALAGRARNPGCKCDYVPVLVGPEGTGKSSTVMALAPRPGFFAPLDLNATNDEWVRRIKGAVIAELAEMRGMRTKDEEHIKNRITTATEWIVPKWKEHKEEYPRRCLMMGTTNDVGVLPAHGEARRFFPVLIEHQADIDGINADREQLWAEGIALHAKHGIMWESAATLAKGERDDFRADDPARNALISYLDTQLSPGEKVGDNDMEMRELQAHLSGVLNDKFHSHHIAQILTDLGYRTVRTTKGKRIWRRKPIANKTE